MEINFGQINLIKGFDYLFLHLLSIDAHKNTTARLQLSKITSHCKWSVRMKEKLPVISTISLKIRKSKNIPFSRNW